jgi:hypothetical protein
LRSPSTDGVDLLEVETAQVGKQRNVVPELDMLLHHSFGREPYARDPCRRLLRRSKNCAAPVGQAFGDGNDALAGFGADGFGALGNEVGSRAVGQVLRGASVELHGAVGHLLAGASHSV